MVLIRFNVQNVATFVKCGWHNVCLLAVRVNLVTQVIQVSRERIAGNLARRSSFIYHRRSKAVS